MSGAIKGHCSLPLQAKVRGISPRETLDNRSTSGRLLCGILGLCFGTIAVSDSLSFKKSLLPGLGERWKTLVATKTSDPSQLGLVKPRKPLVIYDVNGHVIGKFSKNTAALSEISPAFLQAVVAAEDHRFYNHQGVDFVGVLRYVAAGRLHFLVSTG